MLRFLTDKRAAHQQSPAPALDFYREEFLKYQRCLERQREYYSEHAITSAEAALARILAELDQICTMQGGDELVSRLLRQFDIATGLSTRSDPKKAH